MDIPAELVDELRDYIDTLDGKDVKSLKIMKGLLRTKINKGLGEDLDLIKFSIISSEINYKLGLKDN